MSDVEAVNKVKDQLLKLCDAIEMLGKDGVRESRIFAAAIHGFRAALEGVMTDRLTIKQVSEQMNARYSAEKLKEISDMLSQSNDLLDALGPYEHRDISRWQRAKNWCGWKLIKAGAYLMGEHAPYME